MSGEISQQGVEALPEPAQFDAVLGAFILKTYGITPEEAQQTVSFGEKGIVPLWKVFQTGECPVGGWVKTAFAEGGREAVEAKFTLFNQMDPGFNVALGEEAKKKLIHDQELASIARESDNTTPEKLPEVDETRDIQTPNLRPTTEVTVPIQEIVKQQEIATRVTPKEIDIIPTDAVVRIEKPKPQTVKVQAKVKPEPTPKPQTEKVQTKVKPEPTPKITTVRAVEPKPVPAKPKLQPNHTTTNPTVVAEQVTKPTPVPIKSETPMVKALKPTELLYSTIRDAILPELPDIEIQEPIVSTAYIDGEALADENIFTNLETAFELPDFEQLEIALPFIEFQQPEQTALEGEYSYAEEIPSVVVQLYQHFETLEPELAEQADEILNIIMAKIQELESEQTGVDRDALEQEIETICERMLVCMDIEPTPVLVKNLLLVLKIEHQERLALNPQIAYDEGTHERKNAMFQSAYNLPFEISQKLFHSLGRHTLMLAS